jgi:hypothetical protein
MLRQIGLKLEVVAKPGKSPRIIYNEGNFRYLLWLQSSWIFDQIYFHQLMGNWSIKGFDKVKICDALCKRFSTQVFDTATISEDQFMDMDESDTQKLLTNKTLKIPHKTTGIEVDQTSMELHEKYSGTLGFAMEIIFEIMRVLITVLPEAAYVRACFNVIEYDANGFRVRFTPRQPNAQGLFTPIYLSFDELFMTSGWKFTSSVNHVNETGATLSALSKNPESIFYLPAKANRVLQGSAPYPLTLHELGKFRCRFDSHWDKPIYIDLAIEGDDVGGRTSAFAIEHQTQIEKHYSDMGYSSKLKFVTNGRVEFVGIHFIFTDGKSSPLWVPDVFRAIVKVGTCTTTSKQPKLAMIVRFCSLAYMFAGRCDPLSRQFYNYALSHFEELEDGARIVDVRVYDVPMPVETENPVAYGMASVSVNKVLDTCKTFVYCPGTNISPIKQRELVANSLGGKITELEWERWMSYAERALHTHDAEDVLPHLPAIIVSKIRDAYCHVPEESLAKAADNDSLSETKGSVITHASKPAQSSGASVCSAKPKSRKRKKTSAHGSA